MHDPVDPFLNRLIQHSGRNPLDRRVVQAVEDYTRGHDTVGTAVSAQDVLRIASRTLREGGVKEGDRLNARAYLDITKAASQQPFFISEPGADRAAIKTEHYFMSGAISSRVASWFPFLPERLRHALGFHVSSAIGVVKEVADKIKGTGFNEQDIALDRRGARAALRKPDEA